MLLGSPQGDLLSVMWEHYSVLFFCFFFLKRELAVDLTAIPVDSLTSWALESDSPGLKPSHHG